MSHFSLICSLLLNGLCFNFYLLLLQLVLCRVIALKVSPYIIHSSNYIFLLVLSGQRGYSEKSENYHRLRLTSLRFTFSVFNPIWIILKAKIIFSFWSYEISEAILRNQKIVIGLDSFSIIICLFSFSNQRLIYWTTFG